MTTILVLLITAIALPFLFQLAKQKMHGFAGGLAFIAYALLCGVCGFVEAIILAKGDLLTAAVYALAIFMLSQGFYATVLSRFLPGRGSVG